MILLFVIIHLVINIELSPLCSTRFKQGRPSEQAQSIAQFLNDVIRDSKCVVFQKVTTLENKKIVWYLYVDLYCLNYDGNVIDASLIAVVAALKNVCLPKVVVSEEGTLLATNDEWVPLQIRNYPISLTFGMFDDYLLVDPTSEEEELLQGSITIVYNNQGILCSVYKPGGYFLTEEKLKECMKQTKERVSEVITLIESNQKN